MWKPWAVALTCCLALYVGITQADAANDDTCNPSLAVSLATGKRHCTDAEMLLYRISTGITDGLTTPEPLPTFDFGSDDVSDYVEECTADMVRARECGDAGSYEAVTGHKP